MATTVVSIVVISSLPSDGEHCSLYPVMLPFLLSSSGGSQLKRRCVFPRSIAVKLTGDPVGAIQTGQHKLVYSLMPNIR